MTSMNNLAFTWKEQGRDAVTVKLMDEFVKVKNAVSWCEPCRYTLVIRSLSWLETEGLAINDVDQYGKQ
jgi:hypothetical protein